MKTPHRLPKRRKCANRENVQTILCSARFWERSGPITFTLATTKKQACNSELLC